MMPDLGGHPRVYNPWHAKLTKVYEVFYIFLRKMVENLPANLKSTGVLAIYEFM